MRLIAAACTLVIVAFLAVFGAILLHERTIADPVAQSGATTAMAPAAEPRSLSTSPITTLVSAASNSAVLPEPQAAAPPQRPATQTFAQAPARPAPAAAPPPAPVAASCPG